MHLLQIVCLDFKIYNKNPTNINSSKREPLKTKIVIYMLTLCSQPNHAYFCYNTELYG
jgi:hypothetical protein